MPQKGNTKINGVTKVYNGGDEIYYYFPQCFVTASISDDKYKAEWVSENRLDASYFPLEISFSDIVENFNTADIEAYLDKIAEQGFFFEAPQKIDLDNGANIDAGGRLRVSQLNTLLDIKQFKDEQSLLLSRESIGAATQVHDGSDGVDMTVAGNGDAAISSSYQRATYYSGKSQFGEITFSEGQNVTDVVKRIGYFTSNFVTPFNSNKDGFWFEADGSDYRFIIQKDGVEILNVTQDNWNINTASWLDPSKFNVLVFQFLYLGGTALRIGFINEGAITWCHQYNHAGLVADTFIKSPQQPVRYEIRSTGGSANLKQVCMQVASEGSRGELGVPVFIDSRDQALATAGINYGVLAFRLRSGFEDINIVREKLIFNATTQDNYEWRLCLNPTFSAPISFTAVTDSAVEEWSGNTTVTDFGYILDGGALQGNTSGEQVLNSKLKPGTAIDGTRDIIALVITPKSNNLTLDTTMTLTEEI